MNPMELTPKEELSEAFRPWMDVSLQTPFVDPERVSLIDVYKQSLDLFQSSGLDYLSNHGCTQSDSNIPRKMIRGRHLKNPLASLHFERMEKLGQGNGRDSNPLVLTYSIGGDRYIANPEYSHCDRETARWYNRTYGSVQAKDGGINNDEPPRVPQVQSRYGYDKSKTPVMINCDGILVGVKDYMKFQFGKYYRDYKIKADSPSITDEDRIKSRQEAPTIP